MKKVLLIVLAIVLGLLIINTVYAQSCVGEGIITCTAIGASKQDILDHLAEMQFLYPERNYKLTKDLKFGQNSQGQNPQNEAIVLEASAPVIIANTLYAADFLSIYTLKNNFLIRKSLWIHVYGDGFDDMVGVNGGKPYAQRLRIYPLTIIGWTQTVVDREELISNASLTQIKY